MGYSTAGTLISNIVVVRLNSNGTLDASFGAGGIVFTPLLGAGAPSSGDIANAVVIQTDGKIVVVGSSDSSGTLRHFLVVRYNADGTIDTTFNPAGGPLPYTNPPGSVVTDFSGNDTSQDIAYAVAFQSDGKIIAVGSTVLATQHFALARYNADGTLDVTFNPGGGPLPFINPPGTVVTDFDPIGNTSSEQARAVNILPDGRIAVAGFGDLGTQTSAMLARYLPNGALDITFFGGPPAIVPGTVVTQTQVMAGHTDEFYGLALQADGKLVAGGLTEFGGGINFFLARYLTTGALDPSFNGGGAPPGMVVTILQFTSAIAAVALQANGYIVGVGSSIGNNQIAAARYISSVPLTPTTIITPAAGSTIGGVTVISGTAQNPSIIDLFLDGFPLASTVTIGATNTWSVTLPAPIPPGMHTLSAVARYHDDGHVNIAAAIQDFTIVICVDNIDPFVILYDQIYPFC